MWSDVNSFDHRGPEFTRIIEEAEADLKKLMSIPDNYKVLFLQGGASQQFSAIPFNLTQPDDVVDHVSASTTRYALLGAHDWEQCSCCTSRRFAELCKVLMQEKSCSWCTGRPVQHCECRAAGPHVLPKQTA